jgi:hypothetical protein
MKSEGATCVLFLGNQQLWEALLPNAQALAAPLAGVVMATHLGTNPLPATARAAAGSWWKERATDRGRRALAGESSPG